MPRNSEYIIDVENISAAMVQDIIDSGGQATQMLDRIDRVMVARRKVYTALSGLNDVRRELHEHIQRIS